MPTGPPGAFVSFCLHRTTPELLFGFGSLGDSFANHIFLGPEGKASLYTTKRVTRVCPYEPDAAAYTVVPAVRGRMGALAILGVPVGSGEHHGSGGTGSDSREQRPEVPHLMYLPVLRGTIMPKGPTGRTGPWAGYSRPENPSPLPNYETSTIMTRYQRLKDKRKPNKPCSKGAFSSFSDSSELLSGKRSRPYSTLSRPQNFGVL